MNVSKQILEEENLETPQQSVKFLEYYQKHVEKTERQQKRLQVFSKAFALTSVLALAYMAYCYFSPAQTARKTAGGKPHLGAGSVAEETDEMSGMFSGISVFIWGLVLAKARSGMEAANTKDSGSVGGLLKKSAGLIFMIAAASVFQLLSTYKAEMTPSIQSVAKHALQSSRKPDYTESYYDEQSPHYMGGAHNVALANIRQGLKPKLESGHADSYYDQNSPHYMGGAHNVALQAASQKTMGGARNVALSVMDSQEELGGAHNAAYQSLKLQGSRRQKH